jgi:tetratricopeptide (TPR) repeat protein
LAAAWPALGGCGARETSTTPSNEAASNPPTERLSAEKSPSDSGKRAADELLAEAEVLAKSGDFKAAIKRYSDLIVAAPNPTAYAHRADSLIATGDIERGLADYRAAIRLAPRDASLYLARAKALVIKRRFALANADCDRAIALRPRWGDAYLVRGNIQLETQNWDAAIPDLDAAIRLMENPSSPYNNRGVARLYKGQLDLALADYTAALKHNKEFADAYNNRGDLFARRGKLEEALADFSEAIRISPYALPVYENRADVYVRQGRPEQALTDYTKIIERSLKQAAKQSAKLQPSAKLGRVYRKRAAALLALDRADDALSDVNEAIDLNPDDSDAFGVRQRIHLKKGQSKEAADDEQRATEILVRQLPGAKL